MPAPWGENYAPVGRVARSIAAHRGHIKEEGVEVVFEGRKELRNLSIKNLGLAHLKKKGERAWFQERDRAGGHES